MEAAAAVITSQRSSTGGNNSTASTESQNTTPTTVKTSTTGSEIGQTGTVASSTANRSTGSTPVSSSVTGMLHWLYASCMVHRLLQSDIVVVLKYYFSISSPFKIVTGLVKVKWKKLHWGGGMKEIFLLSCCGAIYEFQYITNGLFKSAFPLRTFDLNSDRVIVF